MNFKLLVVCIGFLLLNQIAVKAAKVNVGADNAEALVGTWDILNTNGTVIDSIEVTIAVAKANTARFSYKQLSLDSDINSLEGFLTQDTVIFDLINLGKTQTYVAQVDFTLAGGPGIEIKTQLADCVTGIESSTVVKKYRERLADASARCDGSSLNDSTVANIKFVKRGVNAALVPSSNSIADEIIAGETKAANRIEAAWSIQDSGHDSIQRRLVIKDITSTYLGYKFTYRLLNNITKLSNLSQSDFQTADRVGFVANNYMILNPTVFSKRNELFILKLDTTLEQGGGRELRTDNGDCFPFKINVIGKMACTPNDSSLIKSSTSRRIDGRHAGKIETNLVIVF